MVITVCMVFLVLFSVEFVSLGFAVSYDEATVSLEQAEQDLGSAFAKVAAAESAGADISILLDKLEVAGSFISDARLALKIGDYDSVFSSAVSCSNTVNSVVEDAERLSVDAEIDHRARLTTTMVVSGFGVCLLVVFGLYGWRLLKRWYFKRVLKMKPEVVD